MGKTDETGSTIMHVETEDVDYRIGVYYVNGSLIKLAEPIRMVCLTSPCTYTLSISPTETDYTSYLNVDYTFTFNETTGIWNFVYSDVSGKTSTMNLSVYKMTGTGETLLCSSLVTGSSGAANCNTSGYTGTLKGQVDRAASPPITITQKIESVLSATFKDTWLLWLMALIAIPILMFLALISPVLAVIVGVIALIPAYMFQVLPLSVLSAIAVLGGIVAHFIKKAAS
jgi:hypothetical protein